MSILHWYRGPDYAWIGWYRLLPYHVFYCSAPYPVYIRSEIITAYIHHRREEVGPEQIVVCEKRNTLYYTPLPWG